MSDDDHRSNRSRPYDNCVSSEAHTQNGRTQDAQTNVCTNRRTLPCTNQVGNLRMSGSGSMGRSKVWPSTAQSYVVWPFQCN